MSDENLEQVYLVVTLLYKGSLYIVGYVDSRFQGCILIFTSKSRSRSRSRERKIESEREREREGERLA